MDIILFEIALSINPNAQGAQLLGIVAQRQGNATSLIVTGPFGDGNFTINGCVIGTGCVSPMPMPLVLPEPARPQATIGENVADSDQRLSLELAGYQLIQALTRTTLPVLPVKRVQMGAQ